MEKLNSAYVIETKNFKVQIKNRNAIIDYNNLQIKHGDFVVIEGENGSGKSTFLKIITNEAGNYCSIKEGDIFINGKSLFDYKTDYLRRNIVVNITQFDQFIKGESPYKALIRPAMNALYGQENVKNKKKEIKKLAYKYYDEFLYKFFNTNDQEEHKKNHFNFGFRFRSVTSLSGGQQKMIHILQGIIKAKVIGCNIMLMDEPLNNLDKENKKILLQLIKNLREENPNLTILLITHCKVFPNVKSVLKIKKTEDGNEAEIIRYEQALKEYDCLN